MKTSFGLLGLLQFAYLVQVCWHRDDSFFERLMFYPLGLTGYSYTGTGSTKPLCCLARAKRMAAFSYTQQFRWTEFFRLNVCSTHRLRLVFVILLLEFTDLMFALDSVSAKIAAVQNLEGAVLAHYWLALVWLSEPPTFWYALL